MLLLYLLMEQIISMSYYCHDLFHHFLSNNTVHSLTKVVFKKIFIEIIQLVNIQKKLFKLSCAVF